MHGLVSLLPQPYYARVEAIWDKLEREFNFRGVRITPFPHFSWNIGEDYADEELQSAMMHVARTIRPLRVSATGLGVFSGKSPVVFIPVVKTAELCEVHARIWAATHTIGRGMSFYYDPEHWSPHITLVFNDATPQNFGAVMCRLGFESIQWDLLIDNLTFIYEPGGSVGQVRYAVPFDAKE